jgi:hypothetical protein
MPLGRFGQGPNEAHAQTNLFVDREVGREAHTFFANRNLSSCVAGPPKADPNRAPRTIGIGVLCGVINQLGHDEGDADGVIGVQESGARLNETSQLGVASADHGRCPWVISQFDSLDLRAAIEPLMGARSP